MSTPAVLAAVQPTPLALPGVDGPVGFDDLRFSAELQKVIVPAGRTGRVDLVDPRDRSIQDIAGFSASTHARGGHGESTTSADTGRGLVFASDRTRRELVVADAQTRRVARVKLGGPPDYVRWVAPTNEGSRGLASDAERELVFVGCDEGSAVALSTRDGHVTGRAKAGNGVDVIAYSSELSRLYLPAEDAGTVTVIAVDTDGVLRAVGDVLVARGAHCVTTDDLGNVYVCDPEHGRLLTSRTLRARAPFAPRIPS